MSIQASDRRQAEEGVFAASGSPSSTKAICMPGTTMSNPAITPSSTARARRISGSGWLSPAFAGMSRIERHRAVNALLADEFKAGLHALAIEPAAPGEKTRW